MLSVENLGLAPRFIPPSTQQPTLMWNGKPCFKFGPMSETSTFAFKLGSPAYDVRQWAEWQRNHGMGYVRCYPEQGFGWVDTEAEGRLYPFDQVEPLKFDLDAFNEEYWDNFRKVAKCLLDHEIVIHLQLVQVCYFKEWKPEARRWQQCYWNPVNNVNEWALSLEPRFPFSDRSEQVMNQWKRYVVAVMDAVGELGNVILDIGNELHSAGDWVEWHHEMIDEWERKHGVQVLKGLDYTHMPEPSTILSDDRYDVIMTHGEFVDDAPLLRTIFGKPVLCVISRDSGYMSLGEGDRELNDTTAYTESRFRRFHYRCLMNKVQGVGDYGKMMGGQDSRRGVDIGYADVKQDSERVRDFTRQARILGDFFAQLVDFPSLVIQPLVVVETSTGGSRPYCLTSTNEIVVYLDAGINKHGDGQTFTEATLLIDTRIDHAKYPRDAATASIIIPATGNRDVVSIAKRYDGVWEIPIPEFVGDLLIYIK
jgi:hypothetical protein